MNPVAGLKYNSGAVLSRQLQQIVKIPTSNSYVPFLNYDSPVDSNCPFFYLFAASSAGSDDIAFITSFKFSNGGTPLTEVIVAWGNQAIIDAGNDSYVIVQTCPNDGFVNYNDPISATCASVLPGDLTFGFVSRWSALADSVHVSTKFHPSSSGVGGNFGLVSGLIQQPW